MKKSLLLLIVVLSLFPFLGEGQIENAVPVIELSAISQINEGNSYVTFPTDIGNIEDLWFEANVNPEFYLRQSKNSRLMGVIVPQIILRMYQEESYPVWTPSYMPHVAAYYRLSNQVGKNTFTLFGKIVHHSNGQDGDFYLENGEINVKSGDFSTNYFEAGLIKTRFKERFNAHQFFKTSLEIHLDGLPDKKVEERFGLVRWHNAFSVFKLPEKRRFNDYNKASFSLKGEVALLMDDWDFNNLSWNSLNLKLTAFYHPTFLEEIGFFVQLYSGMDYYNIYFTHHLEIVRFGLMTDKLRF